MWPKRCFSTIFFLSLLLGFDLLAQEKVAVPTYAEQSIGSQDFIQYWAAYQIAKDGKNPYDSAEQIKIQREIFGEAHTSAVMMWNPPWALTLLAPVLSLDFEQASTVWLVLNFVFFFAVVTLSIRTAASNRSLGRRGLLLTGIGCLFYPAWDCIGSGQLGLLLAFAAALSLYLLKIKRDLLSGVSLAILTLKPHLVYLLWPFMVLFIFQQKRWSILIGLSLALIALCLSSSLLSPELPSQWLNAVSGVSGEPSHAVSMSRWRVETMSGWLRSIGFAYFGQDWVSVAYLLPFAVFASLFVYILGHREVFSNKGTSYSIPALIALSVSTSPYGWFSDYSLLLAAHVILLVTLLESIPPRMGGVVGLCFLQLFFLGWSLFSQAAHGYIFVLGFIFGMMLLKEQLSPDPKG